jgi:zinc protease
VPPVTLERQKAAVLRRLEGAAAAMAAVPSARYAETYVAHYLKGDVPLLNAAQRLAVARKVLPTITADDIARAARFWHRRSDLVLQYNQFEWASVSLPTRESLLATLDSIGRLELAPDSAGPAIDAPLMAELPAPGRIVGEKRDAASGVTEWSLSNGARVLFKPTQHDPDEILIDARSPGGFSVLPDTLYFSSGRVVAKIMTEAAGLGGLDRDRLLDEASKIGIREFRVSITHNDESIRVGGSPRDLETLFQVLHLQFTAPKLDTAAITMWKRVGMEGLEPSIDEQIGTLLARGHPRRAPMPLTSVTFADVGKSMAVYHDRFGNAGDFTFTLVGAATPQQVRPLVERYLASLPSTGAREQPKPLDIRPLGNIVRATGRILQVPKASTFLLFDGIFPRTPDAYLAARHQLGALAWVLRLRFTDIMRERMAGTYGVGVQEYTYADPEEHFRVLINFDAAPDRIHEMLDSLTTVLEAVRAADPTPEELRKVAAMQRRAREVALEDNHHWLQTIQLFDRLKVPFEHIVAAPTPVSAAEVRAAAARYLPSTVFVHYTLLPSDSTMAVIPDAPPQATSPPERGGAE